MRSLSLIALLLIVVAGCGPGGPKRFPVSGTVTMPDGSLLADGKIAFMTADGTQPDGGAIKNGKYSFNALPGKKKVEITATREVGAPDPSMGAPRKEQYIAAEFNTETTLEAEVTAKGPNEFNFKVAEQEKK
jgi:predicted small lipoprotein YifL